MTCSLLATVMAMKQQKLSAGVRRDVATTLPFPPHFWDPDAEDLLPTSLGGLSAAPLAGEGLDLRWGGGPLAATAPPPEKTETALKSSPLAGSKATTGVKKSDGGTLNSPLMPLNSLGVVSGRSGFNVPCGMRPCAITALFQGGTIVGAGYEDGAVVVHRLKEHAPTNSAGASHPGAGSLSEMHLPYYPALPSTSNASPRSHHPSTTGTPAASQGAGASVSNRQVQAGSPHPLNPSIGSWVTCCFTLDELSVPLTAEGARQRLMSGVATRGHGSPNVGSKNNSESVANGEKGPTAVKAVHVVPQGSNQFIMAVAYTNWAFITVEYTDHTSVTTLSGGRQPRKQVRISNEYLQNAVQKIWSEEKRRDGKPLEDSVGAGKNGHRGSVSSGKGGGGGANNSVGKVRRGQQNSGNTALATIVIDNITLAEGGTHVAISLTSPAMYVLLLELPSLWSHGPYLPTRVGTPAGGLHSPHGIASAPLRWNEQHVGASHFPVDDNPAPVVVEPERLQSHALYTHHSATINTINGKTTSEILQSLTTSTGASSINSKEKEKAAATTTTSSSVTPIGLTERSTTEPRRDVFSKCFFLRDSHGHPVQLVVVWVNSPLYDRLPLRKPPATFADRVRDVNAPAPPPEEEEKSAKGREKDSSASQRGAGKKGAKAKGSADPAALQRKQCAATCERFPGILHCQTVASIDMAATVPNGQILALCCAGGSVHVLSLRRCLASASALPPPAELPAEWRGLRTHVSVVSLDVQSLPSVQEVEDGLPSSSSTPVAHVVVGTALTAPHRPPLFGAASLFIALGASHCTTSVSGRGSALGSAGLSLPALRLPQDSVAGVRRAGSESAASAVPPHQSLYLSGLPAPLNGALLTDPLPFSLLFMDPYTAHPSSCFAGDGGADSMGHPPRESSASLRTNTGNGTNGSAGMGNSNGIPMDLMPVKGQHHCLVWDTHYHQLLASLPFSLYDDVTKPVKDAIAMPTPTPVRAGRLGSVSGPGMALPIAGRGKGDKGGADPMNLSMRSVKFIPEEPARRVVAVQNGTSSSHSVYHSSGVAANSGSTGGSALVPLSPVFSLSSLPFSSATGGLLWLQNEEAAAAPKAEAPSSLTLTRQPPTAERTATGSHTSDSMTSPCRDGEVAQSPCLRPYYWPFTALVSTLYPSFLSYFPEASVTQIGLLLHQLSPSQRRDSVALMNASHELAARPSNARHWLRRPLLGRPVSGGRMGSVGGSTADGRLLSGRLTPSTGRRRSGAATASWVGRTGGPADHVTLDVANADLFPTKWLTSVSASVDVRRMRLNQSLENFS